MSKRTPEPGPIRVGPPDETNVLSEPLTDEVGRGPAPPKKSRKLDPELQCMARIDALLSDLADDSAGRVISWLIDRYGFNPIFRRIELAVPSKLPPGTPDARD